MKYNVAPFRKSKFVQVNALLSDIKTSYTIFKSSVPLLKIHDASYNTDISLLWTISLDLADTEFHIFPPRWYRQPFNEANSPLSIYQNSNVTPRLHGQNCKFFTIHWLAISRRDLSTKKAKPNIIEIGPESLGVML